LVDVCSSLSTSALFSSRPHRYSTSPYDRLLLQRVHDAVSTLRACTCGPERAREDVLVVLVELLLGRVEKAVEILDMLRLACSS
jgi:hypothetical protein